MFQNCSAVNKANYLTIIMLSTKPTQPVFFVNNDEKMTKMTKTFLIIVDETKTKMKTKTRDENEIEINSILVDDIDENI